MALRRFSLLLQAPLLVVTLGILGLPLVGCSNDEDDEEASCPAGSIRRDGRCYALCDEQLDCKGDPNLKCVMAPPQSPEGACFAVCTGHEGCASGQLCTAATTMKQESVQVCAPRSLLGLPPGNLNDECQQPNDCDLAGGLVCSGGKCRVPGGAPCSGDQCVEGLVCFQGSCQTSQAAPGEPCDATRPCNASDLVCEEGFCRYGCNSLTGCAPGFECRGISGNGSYRGVCVKSTLESGPGQFGTFCSKPEICDKESGFRCVGAVGDADAYCSKPGGCNSDAECPSGYWCGALSTPKDTKGNIDYENPTRICLQREFCSPCENDLDCSYLSGGICVPDKDGEKFCSYPCNPAKNSCIIGAECVDTGGGVFACRPDVGYCHAKGTPSGCDPCRIDEDCGPGSLCRDGTIGNKPSMKWCSIPCGPKDADGKRTCPVAPNGMEMVCLDETVYSLGGPFTSEQPNSIYGMCFRPFTVDNTTSFTKDPPKNACGNGKREGEEECDDGNPFSSDGCSKCKITDNCRFTLVTDNNGSVLKQGADTLHEIPVECQSFLVAGTIQNAGGVAQFRFNLDNGQYSWMDVFTDKVGTCNRDLLASVHTGDYDQATDTVDITDKNGQIAPCNKLSSVIKNLDADPPSLCPGNKLGCGSCTEKGLCGVCDDDSGIGNCPRMLLSSTLIVQDYPVKFASIKQVARISAVDKSASSVSFLAVVDRLTTTLQGPKNPPALSCY
ncbi:MAG: DUF4215 domain-containing protein [Myxococcales bacterium]|nr:DUF4215 domain-containing protein [Polyangiaceae bacterium]MDW8251800.1 DUF4215 domain-containing protein [Myxococcales bacterium]